MIPYLDTHKHIIQKKVKSEEKENVRLGTCVHRSCFIHTINSRPADSDPWQEQVCRVREFSNKWRFDISSFTYLFWPDLYLLASYRNPHVHRIAFVCYASKYTKCFNKLTGLNGFHTLSSIFTSTHLIFDRT